MVPYSKSRWSTINSMFQRLLKLKEVLTVLPLSCIYQRGHHNPDPTFQLPPALLAIVNSGHFWESLARTRNAYGTICKCIGVSESDSASFSTAFVSLLYARVHLKTSDWQSTSKHEQLEA